MTFDLDQFLAPLTPLVILSSAIIGLGMGLAVRRMGHGAIAGHAYWLLATGTVFFVPLSILRGMEGSLLWPRFLATLVLWVVYVACYEFGIRVRWPR